MRRPLCILVLTTLLAGCGTLGSSLPYHSGSEDSMGMTVEQYAIGRLPAGHRPSVCPKTGAHSTLAPGPRHPSRRCGKR